MTTEVTIHITSHDIATCTPGAMDCPVLRAMRRKGIPVQYVTPWSWFPDWGADSTSQPMPIELGSWLKRWNDGVEQRPGRFTLKVPTDPRTLTVPSGGSGEAEGHDQDPIEPPVWYIGMHRATGYWLRYIERHTAEEAKKDLLGGLETLPRTEAVILRTVVHEVIAGNVKQPEPAEVSYSELADIAISDFPNWASMILAMQERFVITRREP